MTAKSKSKTTKGDDEGSFLKSLLCNPLIDGVKWSERYDKTFEKFWSKFPNFFLTMVGTLAVFTFGSTLRGEWVIILVTALKQYRGEYNVRTNETKPISELFTLSNLKMEELPSFIIGATVVSYAMYFGVGGFLHWYFYVKRRDSAGEWKIQPKKWLTPEVEWHEVKWGTITLTVNSIASAFLACYIYNGNPCTVYFQWDEYGAWWFFLQIPVLFVLLDYTTYFMHRFYHIPFFYKNFHKLHHTYKQPTAFSVTAIHPVESLHFQFTLTLPLFVFPVHWMAFYIVVMYNYYHGIIDHSGINFKAYWWQPWQPDADFHDKHHEFFHCNFAFNMHIWDRIHGTDRKANRIYTEETFVGMELKRAEPEEKDE